jgi:hypothetical protein
VDMVSAFLATTAHSAERDGGSILTTIRMTLFNFACRDPHHVDGIGDDIGRSFPAFGVFWHVVI